MILYSSKKQQMNFRLFFLIPKIFCSYVKFREEALSLLYVKKGLLLSVLFFASSCARKNSHVYDFRVTEPTRISPLSLPYVKQLQVSIEADRYKLVWSPILSWDLPEGFSLTGYTVYQQTDFGVLPRCPLLQVAAGVHECEVIAFPAQTIVFAVAPLFSDAQGREISGLVTPKKIPPT